MSVASGPGYFVSCDGDNITDKIQSRLLKLSVKDEAGFKNDRLEITLADYPPYITFPDDGATFNVQLGPKGGMVDKGTWIFDELEASDDPVSKLHITAHADDTGGPFKSSKHRSWHDVTISDIVNKIAGDNGFSPAVDSTLGAIKVKHRDQTNQSDMAFLTHLANENDAIMKVADKTLYFAPRNQAKSLSGKSAPNLTINRTDCKSYKYTKQSRSKFKGVKARYRKMKDAKEYYAHEGEDSASGMYTVPEIFNSKDDAQRAAKGKHKAMSRSQETLSLTISPGNPNVAAEGHITLAGFRPGVTTDWLVSSCTHEIDGDGAYTTKAECELPDSSSGSSSGSSDTDYYAHEGEDAGGGDKEEKKDNVEGGSGSGGSGGGVGGISTDYGNGGDVPLPPTRPEADVPLPPTRP